MKNSLRRAGAIALATVLAVGFSGTAKADTMSEETASDCFVGKFCIWQDSFWNGPLGMYNVSTTCYSMGVMNNAASSVYNRTGRGVRMYDSGDCSGAYSVVLDGDAIGSMSATGVGNDHLSSFKYN